MKDYVALARGYEADVLAGRIPAGKWVRLACERSQRDHARAAANDPAFPYRFDEAELTRRCWFAELFPHIKGPLAKVVGQDDEGRNLWHYAKLAQRVDATLARFRLTGAGKPEASAAKPKTAANPFAMMAGGAKA